MRRLFTYKASFIAFLKVLRLNSVDWKDKTYFIKEKLQGCESVALVRHGGFISRPGQQASVSVSLKENHDTFQCAVLSATLFCPLLLCLFN